MTPAQILARPSIEKAPLRKFKHLNPLDISLEGIQRVVDSSVWAGAADAYSYDIKIIRNGVVIGVLLCGIRAFGIYRTEVVGSEVKKSYWALTDRWDEHMLTIDAFNLPDPDLEPVTALDEDVIPAPPNNKSIPHGHIL